MTAPQRDEQPVIVVIRTSLRPDADASAYGVMGARMDELARTIPGFIDAKGYKSEDGDEISLVTFASREALRAWREHPEHLEAQRAGRERFYASYQVQVCAVERAYTFSLDAGRSA